MIRGLWTMIVIMALSAGLVLLAVEAYVAATPEDPCEDCR